MGMLDDARNIRNKDPTARSLLEVILLYPGFRILVNHRVAHWLYQHKRFFLARWLSQRSLRKTGIEIHPGASIVIMTTMAVFMIAKNVFNDTLQVEPEP